MSQAVVLPARNAVREAKRIKDVRKVKGAILWHERERAKKQKMMHERWETRQAKLQMQRFELDRAKDRKKALRHAKEDWQLGPLRPNRSIGDAKEKYGALRGEEIQKPETPLHALKAKNERRVKLGLEPEYPLIVDDKKYFHLAKDDRVVVIRGREMGKIGTIRTVIDRTHEVMVEGLNMQYFDGKQFSGTGEEAGPKRLSEVPIPMDDVRLVVPYEITKKERRVEKDENGRIIGEKFEDVIVREDVIVDGVTMRQHITGVDPYTNVDYGNAEFPKEHRLDPRTGLPIFHRYISGTNHRIEWPWEMETAIEDSGATEEVEADGQSKLQKLTGAMFSPLATYKRWRVQDGTTSTQMTAAAEQSEKDIAERVSDIEKEVEQARRTAPPSSQDPHQYSAWDEIDTTQGALEEASSAQYTLVRSPLPPELRSELSSHKRDQKKEAQKKKNLEKKAEDATDAAPVVTKKKKKGAKKVLSKEGEAMKAKEAAAQRMKTPMQLRWEMEHAKKVKQPPLVTVDEIFDAVNKHLSRHKVAGEAGEAKKEVD